MIYVFDLDGTLCTETGGRYQDAEPLEARIARVNQLHAEGHHIIIDSARGSMTHVDWRELTRRQLELWGVKYHVLRVGKKFYGDIYVDDHAIHAEEFFCGVVH